MGTLTPRVVLVHRRTEYEDLLARHGTRGQAAFFLAGRGLDLTEVDARHDRQQEALAVAAAAIPADWRRGRVERSDLDRFLFSPEDLVVVVGQDGLVANVAKYLHGQPVIGVNPDPERNPGVLVRHAPAEAARLLDRAEPVRELTMVHLSTDDGRDLVALNEVYLGHPSHQTARWTIEPTPGSTERQATSGMVVATGTGATGWCRSIAGQRGSDLPLPGPTEPRLAWFVREAWPSPATGTDLVEGTLGPDGTLRVRVETDGLVAFGDGMEADRLTLGWGQTVTVRVAEETLRLV